MSRVLGNGHALVLRGARHSNVSGLPVHGRRLVLPGLAVGSVGRRSDRVSSAAATSNFELSTRRTSYATPATRP